MLARCSGFHRYRLEALRDARVQELEELIEDFVRKAGLKSQTDLHLTN